MTASVELGVDAQHVRAMQKRIDVLERENDAISDRAIRHAISHRLVEIRLFLRDGHLENMNKSSRETT
jgi:hypothetical protein